MDLRGLFLAGLRGARAIRQVTVLRIPCAEGTSSAAAQRHLVEHVEMKLQYALYVVMLLSQHELPVLGQDEDEAKTYRITDRVYTCSSWLSMLINKFCDNIYKIVKRDTSLLIDKLTPKGLQEHRRRERVLAEERWQRVRRQVASECCDQPCTVANVIRYCPDDARLIRERPDIFED